MTKICTYFGLPGHGKTTYAAYLIYKYTHKRFFGLIRPRYEIIYTNIPISMPESNIIRISKDDLGVYGVCGPRAAIVYDEASQSFDNREFKNFGREKVKYFNEIRHHRIDECDFFVQKYDALDAKIKAICSRVYWVYRIFPHLPYFRIWKIPHEVLLAKKKDAAALSAGEIITGYTRPNFFARMFCKRIDGSKYFKYFNSYEVDYLPPLPQCKENEIYKNAYHKTYGIEPDFEHTLGQAEVRSLSGSGAISAGEEVIKRRSRKRA